MGANGDAFLQLCALSKREFGLDEQEVKKILKMKWNSFNPQQFQEYVAFISLEVMEREQQRKLKEREEELNRRYSEEERETLYGPRLCPICNTPTIPDTQWRGKYTNRPGWRCENGILHFLQWKANRVCDGRGDKSPFPEIRAI